jgi:4-hydroxymandelate oxidase
MGERDEARAPSPQDSGVPALYSLDDFEEVARERLEPSVYEFVAGGAGNGDTVERNRRVFDQWLLMPRVMVDVSRRDPNTTVLGQRISFPLLIAPSALQRLLHPGGELATAEAAARAGTAMVLSMNASMPLEEVATAGGLLWFQLYVYKDRGVTEQLVARAAAAGYRALCVTVDHAVMPWRVRELRQPLRIPPDITFSHLAPERQADALDAGFCWDTLAWLRTVTDLPIVLKGILNPADAALAAEHGVDAVIVSNHGGRQLAGSVTAMDVLPAVVEAVDDRLEVLADGGIRSGIDLFRMIALGARAGLIGRPALWGLAAAGSRGVERVLEVVREEFVSAMGSTACTTTAEIGREALLPAP